MNVNKKSKAFTIVEIIVVVIVIGILASITVVSYGQVTKNAREKSVATDAAGMRAAIMKYKAEHGSYPTSLSQVADAPSTSSTLQYSAIGSGYFCLAASTQTISMYVSSVDSSPKSGTSTSCTSPDIQIVTTASCPTTRTVAKDARDNHTYWIQKLADGKCWMLTNLAYAGGGTNTYSDVMPTGDGTSGTLNNGTSDTSTTYVNAKYYIPAGANPTTAPTEPSTSTDGGATNPQYGYLYNWCAAMKAQTTTSACSNASTPLPDTTTSICPAGWRLPTGGSSGEFKALNTTVNSGSTSSSSGLLGTWLAQYGGYWGGGFFNPGSDGYYWSSTQGDSDYAYYLYFVSSYVNPSDGYDKNYGRAVRCLAL